MIHLATAAGIGFDNHSVLHLPLIRKHNLCINFELSASAKNLDSATQGYQWLPHQHNVNICFLEEMTNFDTVLTFLKIDECWCDFVSWSEVLHTLASFSGSTTVTTSGDSL